MAGETGETSGSPGAVETGTNGETVRELVETGATGKTDWGTALVAVATNSEDSEDGETGLLTGDMTGERTGLGAALSAAGAGSALSAAGAGSALSTAVDTGQDNLPDLAGTSRILARLDRYLDKVLAATAIGNS